MACGFINDGAWLHRWTLLVLISIKYTPSSSSAFQRSVWYAKITHKISGTSSFSIHFDEGSGLLSFRKEDSREGYMAILATVTGSFLICVRIVANGTGSLLALLFCETVFEFNFGRDGWDSGTIVISSSTCAVSREFNQLTSHGSFLHLRLPADSRPVEGVDCA